MNMKKPLGSFLAICLLSLSITVVSSPTSQAGPLDCFKATKYSKYSKLRSAFLKDPAKKTDADWFRAYTFATIFNGYPKCFNKQDVATMRSFIKVIDQTCARNKNLGTICSLAPVRGALADWAYNSYK